MIPAYLYTNTFPTGSNYICNPPVTNTDIDQMFLVSNLTETKEALIMDGWVICGTDKGDLYPDDYSDWLAFRKGNNNALCTNNVDYYLKFYKATELAKKQNLLNKQDRINLFSKITGRQNQKKPRPLNNINVETINF